MPRDRAPRGGKPAAPRSSGRSGASGPSAGRSSSSTAGSGKTGGRGASGGRSAGPSKFAAPGASAPRARREDGEFAGKRGPGGRSAEGEERRPSRGPAAGGRGRSAEGPGRGRAEGPSRGPARGRSDEGMSRGPVRARSDEGMSRGPARGRSDEGAGRGPARGRGAEGAPARGRGAEAARGHEIQEEFETRGARAEESSDEGAVHGQDIVFGRHPAIAALEGPAAVNKVWVLNGLRNQALIAQVRQLAKEKGATVQMVERPKLDQLTLDGNHQGIVVSLAMASYVELEEVVERAKATPYPAILMLDGIEDPHNLGALVRTAEGAGFAGVVIASRRAVGLTPTVAKAAAGALQRVPVARVGNLNQAVETLKAAGFWLIGADSEGEQLPYEVDMARPIALVIGGEGKGLSRLTAEKCDWRVRLTLGGELESLNASVAGGILMYEAVRQRWAAGKQG